MACSIRIVHPLTERSAFPPLHPPSPFSSPLDSPIRLYPLFSTCSVPWIMLVGMLAGKPPDTRSVSLPFPFPLYPGPPPRPRGSQLIMTSSGGRAASVQRPRWSISPRRTSRTDGRELHRRLAHGVTGTNLRALCPVGQQRKRGYPVGCSPAFPSSERALRPNWLSVRSPIAPVRLGGHTGGPLVVHPEPVVAAQPGGALPCAQRQEEDDESVLAVYVRPSPAV